jgi:hypothetical protein
MRAAHARKDQGNKSKGEPITITKPGKGTSKWSSNESGEWSAGSLQAAGFFSVFPEILSDQVNP